MKFTGKLGHIWAGTLLLCTAFAALGSTGCTVNTNGMTLPSPYYYKNRPQYFPSGQEFPFPNEAASLQNADSDFHQSHGH